MEQLQEVDGGKAKENKKKNSLHPSKRMIAKEVSVAISARMGIGKGGKLKWNQK